MRCGIVKNLHNERVPFKRLPHDGALNACSASVDESQFPESRCMRFRHILLDDRWDVGRCERVEVQRRFDGDSKGLVVTGVEGVLILHFV